MAKINLLTLHYADNNGSFFQAYATCKILQELGHAVTVIDLREQYEHKYRINKRNLIRLLSYPRRVRFELMRRKYFPAISKKMYSVDLKRLPEADYYVVGSDQVWNYDITGRYILNYFFDFVLGDVNRFSLASSFGKKTWKAPLDVTNAAKNLIGKMSGVSVREESGIAICREIFNVDAKWIVDPTLALMNYDEILNPNKCQGPRQIGVSAFLFKRGYAMDIFEEMSHKIEGKYVLLSSIFSKSFYKGGKYFMQSPKEWLSCIRKSQFFITDSFHGVAFAIICNTPFIATVADPEKIERIESLLSIFSLSSRLVKSKEDFQDRCEELLEPVNWDNVNRIRLEKAQEFRVFVQEMCG